MNPAEEATHWDWVAGDFARLQANVYEGLDLEDCIGAIEPAIKPGLITDGVILELGCGPGRLLHAFVNSYPLTRFVGLDSSPHMVELAMMTEYPNLHVQLGDGRTIPGLESFDAAYSMTTFQHIPADAQAGYLVELGRMLRPRGALRFQFVHKAEAGPFSHPVPVRQMLSYLDAAGLRDVKIDIGLMYAEWCWITAIKP